MSDFSVLDKKIGQRFIFGINNGNIDVIINLIKKGYIGGVVLYKNNYKNYQEMLSVINKFKEANKGNDIPLFVAIDQEGGIVNRLPNEIHALKNITDVSMIDKNLVGNYANIIGKILNKSGINMNFAPVLDIYNNSKSKALYKRCFSGNETQIGKLGISYVEKLSANKVIGVCKHFPGHGASSIDSHFLVPYIFNYNMVLNHHINPFNIVMDKCDAIMVGHIAIRKLTGFLPASISNKFISKYLKEKFDGLIITDEINMLRHNPVYRLCYLNKILKSLNDIILVKVNNEKEGYNIINKYKKMILKSDIEKQKLDTIYERIKVIKEKYEINDNLVLDGINIDEVNLEIDKINSDVLNGG